MAFNDFLKLYVTKEIGKIIKKPSNLNIQTNKSVIKLLSIIIWNTGHEYQYFFSVNNNWGVLVIQYQLYFFSFKDFYGIEQEENNLPI